MTLHAHCNTPAWVLSALLATAHATALAAPVAVAEAELIPVDIRRTTFVVRDIDKALALYRDTLGLTLLYDQLIGGDVIPVMFSAVWDADGNYIELNKLLGAPAGSMPPDSVPGAAPASSTPGANP